MADQNGPAHLHSHTDLTQHHQSNGPDKVGGVAMEMRMTELSIPQHLLFKTLKERERERGGGRVITVLTK